MTPARLRKHSKGWGGDEGAFRVIMKIHAIREVAGRQTPLASPGVLHENEGINSIGRYFYHSFFYQ